MRPQGEVSAAGSRNLTGLDFRHAARRVRSSYIVARLKIQRNFSNDLPGRSFRGIVDDILQRGKKAPPRRSLSRWDRSAAPMRLDAFSMLPLRYADSHRGKKSPTDTGFRSRSPADPAW